MNPIVRVMVVCAVLIVGTLLCDAARVFAQVTASPIIIDETVSPRDLFERTIVIYNNTASPIRIFPSVNEITLDDGGGIKDFVAPSVADRSKTVTTWLAFPRGRIELAPGASTSLSVSFSIDQAAKPGLYHAFLGLGQGSSRDEAEAKVFNRTAPGVLIRIAVEDTRIETLRLSRFTVERIITGTDQTPIAFELINPGEVPVVPQGMITLYNSRGEVVAEVPINDDGQPIPPSERREFTVPIETPGLFGRYKAFLSLEYGSNRATVHDTAFFYAAPWTYLVALFSILFIITLSLLLWSRRSLQGEHADERFDYVTMSVRSGTSRADQGHDITLKKGDETQPG